LNWITRGSQWKAIIIGVYGLGALGSSTPSAGAEAAGSANIGCLAATAFDELTLTDAAIGALANEPHLLLAQQDVVEARADKRAAVSPFLPKGQLLLDEERFEPAGGYTPVTVVGSNILGGTRTYSAYGAVSVSWNIFSSGHDVAGLHEANAEVRSSQGALVAQLDDSLSDLLKAYAEAYETRLDVSQQESAVSRLKAIEARAEDRFQHGDGTIIAIGQAREAALDAEQTFNATCRTLTEKSLALAKAMGKQLPDGRLALATAELPEAPAIALDSTSVHEIIEADPAVVAAKEKLVEAQAKLTQTRSAFGPSIEIDAKRDYLGQNIDSLSAATHTVSPNSYRIGVSLVQPIFPFTTESSALSRTRAEVRKAEITVSQVKNDVDARIRIAISTQMEANASYRAALSSVTEARSVLALTTSLRKAGRVDMDSVEHAQLDLEKAEVTLRVLASHRRLAEWDVARALEPARFAKNLLAHIGIDFTSAGPFD
jgi:outer membrane protein TolC